MVATNLIVQWVIGKRLGRPRFVFIAALLLFSSAVTAQQPAASDTQKTDADTDPVQQELNELRTTRDQLQAELLKLRKTAAMARAFDTRNQTLETQVVELERELLLARQELNSLRDSNRQDWFLRGAGVLLAGALIGALLPRLQRPKPQRWSDL